MIRGAMPPMSQPFVLPDGTLDPAAFLFLQTLHQRTGGSPGIDVLATTATTSAGFLQDVPTPPAAPGQAIADVASPLPGSSFSFSVV